MNTIAQIRLLLTNKERNLCKLFDITPEYLVAVSTEVWDSLAKIAETEPGEIEEIFKMFDYLGIDFKEPLKLLKYIFVLRKIVLDQRETAKKEMLTQIQVLQNMRKVLPHEQAG